MTTKNFLIYAGLILIVLAGLAYFNILGPTPENSIFQENFWFNWIMLWLNLGFGVLSFLFAFILPPVTRKYIVIFQGIIALAIAITTIFTTEVFGANLTMPGDTILYAFFGLWAFITTSKSK